MKRTIFAFSAVLLLATRAEAIPIDLGQLRLAGDFTLNHDFDFDHPELAPFGTFATLTIVGATGVFAPHTSIGGSLGMNTPGVYQHAGSGTVDVPGSGTFVGTLPQAMSWSAGGFTLNTLWTNITGADADRYVLGLGALSGNGFDASSYPFVPVLYWNFTAPAYDISNFPYDITHPIDLTIGVQYNDGVVVPEPSSVLLFSAAFLAVQAARWRRTTVRRRAGQ